MIRLYILDGHEPVPVHSVEEWGRWFQANDRLVDLTELPGGVAISTVFIGVDHGLRDGPPLIFESLIFGGPHDGEMERCSTWGEAIHMHQRLCALAHTGNITIL